MLLDPQEYEFLSNIVRIRIQAGTLAMQLQLSFHGIIQSKNVA